MQGDALVKQGWPTLINFGGQKNKMVLPKVEQRRNMSRGGLRSKKQAVLHAKGPWLEHRNHPKPKYAIMSIRGPPRLPSAVSTAAGARRASRAASKPPVAGGVLVGLVGAWEGASSKGRLVSKSSIKAWQAAAAALVVAEYLLLKRKLRMLSPPIISIISYKLQQNTEAAAGQDMSFRRPGHHLLYETNIEKEMRMQVKILRNHG